MSGNQVSLGTTHVAARIVGTVLIGFAVVLADHARAEEKVRPPIGGVASLPDAMIFYVARGPLGACGQNCSEWIAAEGSVHWDTYKRFIAILDRHAGRKLPVFLRVWGEGNLSVATSIGKVIRARGLDVSVGSTLVEKCAGATDVACIVLKRGGGPLEARIDVSTVQCDVVCVLMLAGGVRRSLPAGAEVVIGGTGIRNRLGLNVAEAHRKGVHSRDSDQIRLYLTQMGVDPALMDVINQNYETPWQTGLSPDYWTRLRIVNVPAL